MTATVSSDRRRSCASHTAAYVATMSATVVSVVIAQASHASDVLRTLHHGHFGPLAL